MSAYLLQLFLQKNVLCGFYYPQSTVLITLFYCSFYSALFVPSVSCSLVYSTIRWLALSSSWVLA